MADEKFDPRTYRHAIPGRGPGKTPGSAEGEDDGRSKPFPNEPRKTPGSAEGEEIHGDPGTSRGPVPHAP